MNRTNPRKHMNASHDIAKITTYTLFKQRVLCNNRSALTARHTGGSTIPVLGRQEGYY